MAHRRDTAQLLSAYHAFDEGNWTDVVLKGVEVTAGPQVSSDRDVCCNVAFPVPCFNVTVTFPIDGILEKGVRVGGGGGGGGNMDAYVFKIMASLILQEEHSFSLDLRTSPWWWLNNERKALTVDPLLTIESVWTLSSVSTGTIRAEMMPRLMLRMCKDSCSSGYS